MIPAAVARVFRRSAWPAALLLAATWAACSLLELPSEPGSVLFQDDYSRQSSGWDRYRDETYSTHYAGGAYRIHVLRPNTDAWVNPGLDLGDAPLEVDATKAGGPDDNV